MKSIDISGQRYNNLVAIKPDPENKKYWLFRCDCGTIKKIARSNVIYGSVSGCGCLLRDAGLGLRIDRMKSKMIGERFNRLVVLNFHSRRGHNFYWKCLCDCGIETIVSTNTIRSGKTKSCGCFIERKREQGFSGLKRLYLIYKQSAKKRSLSFKLTIDEFKKITSLDCSYCGGAPSEISDHSKSYKKGIINNYTVYKYNGIDRINSNKGYEVGNITTCCSLCNYIKRTSTLFELKDHITRICEHLK